MKKEGKIIKRICMGIGGFLIFCTVLGVQEASNENYKRESQQYLQINMDNITAKPYESSIDKVRQKEEEEYQKALKVAEKKYDGERLKEEKAKLKQDKNYRSSIMQSNRNVREMKEKNGFLD